MFLLENRQKELRAELRRFVDAEILPVAADYDRRKVFPWELYKRIGEQGYLDAEFAYTGTGAKYGCLEGSIIIEEISRGMASLGISIAPHYQCTELIAARGSETLKQKTVEAARRGELLLAFAITEASGGSDALGVDTIAVKDGDKWILNGRKCWITNAGAADGYIVTAKSPSSDRSRSVSLFYISKDAPGFKIIENDRMMGLRNSSMGEIIMDDCTIPDHCLIGKENDSYPLIKPLLNEGRLDMAAVALGISQAALEFSAERAEKRDAYGRSLSSHQAISFSLANMYTNIMMARNSLYSVASAMTAGLPSSRDAAALKLYATETCCEICKNACQIHGAYGLSADSDVERLFRDAQMLTIAEGTSEICRIVVSNGVYSSLRKDR